MFSGKSNVKKSASISQVVLNSDLFVAIASNQLDAVQAAINAGAEVNCRNQAGESPLVFALSYATLPAIFELLIANKADVNATLPHTSKTLLDQAVALRDKERVALLLDHGARSGAMHKGQEIWMDASSDSVMLALLMRKGVKIDWSYLNNLPANKCNIFGDISSLISRKMVELFDSLTDPEMDTKELIEALNYFTPYISGPSEKMFKKQRAAFRDGLAGKVEGWLTQLNAKSNLILFKERLTLIISGLRLITDGFGTKESMKRLNQCMVILSKTIKDQHLEKPASVKGPDESKYALFREHVDTLANSLGAENVDHCISEINDLTLHLKASGKEKKELRNFIAQQIQNAIAKLEHIKPLRQAKKGVEAIIKNLDIIKGRGSAGSKKASMVDIEACLTTIDQKIMTRHEVFLSRVQVLHVDEVKAFLDDGVDVNYVGKNGTTPLYVAVSWNRLNIAELLIKSGANVNFVVQDFPAPLMITWALSSLPMVKLLVENGVTLDCDKPVTATTDHDKGPALYWVSHLITDDIKSITRQRLVSPNSNLDETIHRINQKTKLIPKHFLDRSYQAELFNIFNKAIDEQCSDLPGKHPHRTNALDILLNVNKIMDHLDMLHWAPEGTQTTALGAFREKLTTEIAMQGRLLIASVESQDLEGVKDALAAGADPNACVNDAGFSPLVIAALNNRRDIARVLNDHDAEVNWNAVPLAQSRILVADMLKILISEEIVVLLINISHVDFVGRLRNAGYSDNLMKMVKRMLTKLASLDSSGFSDHKKGIKQVYGASLESLLAKLPTGSEAELSMKALMASFSDAPENTVLAVTQPNPEPVSAPAPLEPVSPLPSTTTVEPTTVDDAYNAVMNDMADLANSSGGLDTDTLIDNLNKNTANFLDKLLHQRTRKDMRKHLMAVFNAKDASIALGDRRSLLNVLCKVVTRLRLIQGPGQVNGEKEAMHVLKTLRNNLSVQVDRLALMEEYAEPNVIIDPFLELTSGNKTRMVAALDKNKDDVNCKNASGETPLMFLARYHDREMLQVLIANGATIDWVGMACSGITGDQLVDVCEALCAALHQAMEALMQATEADKIAALITSINDKMVYLAMTQSTYEAKVDAYLADNDHKRGDFSIPMINYLHYRAKVVNDLKDIMLNKRMALAKTTDEASLTAVQACLMQAQTLTIFAMEGVDELKGITASFLQHLKVRIDWLTGADAPSYQANRTQVSLMTSNQKSREKAQRKPEKEAYYGIQDNTPNAGL